MSPHLAAGTVVAKSCLSFARVLAASFAEHHPDIPFFVLLADEVERCFDPAAEAFELLQLGELAIPHLERFRFRHLQQPLSYAAAPFLVEHLFDRGYERVLFLKQESLVVGDLAPLFDRLEGSPIVLTPHLVEPLSGAGAAVRELNVLLSGSFNLGVLGVSAAPEGRRFLAWWEDRVLHHCRHAVGEGLHYEQRWIDLVPALFAGASIVRDPGANVGHWCLPEREVEVRDGAVWAGGERCSVFRFSGFDPETPEAVTRYSNRLRRADLGPAAQVFTRFLGLLAAVGHGETRAWPYSYGRFDNGVEIPEISRRIYDGLGEAVEAFGDPFHSEGERSYFRWLNQPVDGTPRHGPAITRLWYGIHGLRPDVQAAFPDPLGRNRLAFRRWTTEHGAREHSIPEAFSMGPAR